MEYITMIMSGLALLAATISLVITVREKKRNQKRNADIVNFVEAECKAVSEAVGREMQNHSTKFDEFSKAIRRITTKVDVLFDNFKDYSTKVDNLEKGIVPDYEEALAAKNSVDEFNRGLSAIMGFDPMEAVRKSREERKYGGEVK